MTETGKTEQLSQLLAERRLILCEQALPGQCLHCEATLPPADVVELMMIDTQGEAVVTPGPIVFCQHCRDAYAEEAYYSGIASRFGFDPYTLVGFIDLSLWPEDKRHLEFGADPELDLPLVEFAQVQALRPAKLED